MKRMRKGFIVPAITWLIAVALVFSMESAAQAPESDSPPPAQLVLLPPENAAAACSKDVFNELTKRYRSCAIAFYDRKDPSEDCCSGLAEFYGPNSTRSSRNCFCDASIWSDFISWRAIHYYNFKTAFLFCSRLGYIVPFNEEEGQGYCYDVPPTEKKLAAATFVAQRVPVASSMDYMKRLHLDELVTISFATGIVSGFGMLLLLWPLTWEAAISLKEALKA